MRLNYDIKNKKAGIDADVEGIIMKGMEQHDKGWKEKFYIKYNAKKEMKELKHKQKLENRKIKKKKRYEVEIEEKIRKEKIKQLEKQRKNQLLVRNVSIILIFIFGLFCIQNFENKQIISAFISLVQICLLVISIFMCEDVFHLFKKDYKIFFIISILLIVVWIAFTK